MKSITVLILALGTAASAAPGKVIFDTSKVEQDITRVKQEGEPTIVYVNPWGATYTQGGNDAVANTSPIPGIATATIPPLDITPSQWASLYECVRWQFAPFNVVVTDQDPGNVDHIEASIGGRPEMLGLSGGIGGIAPATCQPFGIPSAVVFNFESQGISDRMCHTIAQEVGHAMSLDHQMMCEDPMTYLDGCGKKSFQDADVRCGEDQDRDCSCGNQTQNSYKHLLRMHGVGPDCGDRCPPTDKIKPTLEVLSPKSEKYRTGGVLFHALASDDYMIQRTTASLNGERIALGFEELNREVFLLGLGKHEYEIVTTDISGNTESETGSFIFTKDGQEPQCLGDDDCETGSTCFEQECLRELHRKGNGKLCELDNDCFSQQCQLKGEEARCSVACDFLNPCDPGLVCLEEKGDSFCWPGNKNKGSGGCSTSSAPLALLFAFFAAGMLPRSRR